MHRLHILESELESLEKLGNNEARKIELRKEIKALLERAEQSKRLIEEYRSRIIRIDGPAIAAPLMNAKLRSWIQEEQQRLKEMTGEDF